MKDKYNSSVTNGSRKLLSIVMTGRDDDYMVDFKYRITTTINHIARNLQRLGRLDQVQIVVVDWGSEVPLSQTLPLSDEAGQVSQFVYVPSKTVKAVQNGKDSFHNSKACNTGIRRSNAEFVMLSAADTLIPRMSLESVLRLLNGEIDLSIRLEQTYFLCNRVHAPWQFVESKPDLDEWDRYLLMAPEINPDANSTQMFLGSSCGGLMMHTSLWQRFRGVNEQIAGWGNSDFELMTRVAQYYPWLALSNIGVLFCHMGHSPYGRRGRLEAVEERPEKALAMTDSPSVNEDDWGLFEYELDNQQSTGRRSCLSKVDPVSKPSSEKCSDISIDNISSDINGDDVRDMVNRTLFLASETSAVMESGEISIIYFVCWYALRCPPKSCLEFGSKKSYSIIPAAFVNPVLEIYYVDRFVGAAIGKGPFEVANHLRSVGYLGYARYINGDPSTALERLNDSFIGDCLFDLMVVRGDIFEKNSVKQVEKLTGHLTKGGALVYSRSTTVNFCDDWAKLQAMLPDFNFIQSKTTPVGIILKPPIVGVISSCLSDPALNVVDFGPFPTNLRRIYYYGIFKLLATPSKYRDHATRVFAKLNSKLRRVIISSS